MRGWLAILLECAAIVLVSECERFAGAGGAHDPQITPEYLLSHGFKRSPESRRTFVAEKIRLADAVRNLGVPLSRVYPLDAELMTPETRNSGMWAVIPMDGCAIYVYSGRTNLSNRKGSDPNETCRIVVDLDFATPSAEPRVRIKSLAITDAVKRDLRVVFELSAVGKTPLAFSQAQFGVHLTGRNLKRELVGTAVVLPKDTPKVVTVSGAKSILLTMHVRANFEDLDERVNLASLAPGDYRLGVILFGDPKGPREFDYQFLGRFESDDYVIHFRPSR